MWDWMEGVGRRWMEGVGGLDGGCRVGLGRVEGVG